MGRTIQPIHRTVLSAGDRVAEGSESQCCEAPEAAERFSSEKELAKISADWPMARFAYVWNGFAGSYSVCVRGISALTKGVYCLAAAGLS